MELLLPAESASQIYIIYYKYCGQQLEINLIKIVRIQLERDSYQKLKIEDLKVSFFYIFTPATSIVSLVLKIKKLYLVVNIGLPTHPELM